jgi:hypothetical protein
MSNTDSYLNKYIFLKGIGGKLFACEIIWVGYLKRKGVANNETQEAKMVKINKEFIYEFIFDEDKGRYVAKKFTVPFSVLDRILNLNGTDKVVINKNKTPYHWLTTKYPYVGGIVKDMQKEISELVNLSDIN